MKIKLIAAILVILLAVAGCSSSGEKSTAGGKLATVNTLLSKGYEMSENQLQTINQLVAEGKDLADQGKREEADKLFDKAIAMLEVIGETDRFNKSE